MNEHKMIISLLLILIKYLVTSLTHKEFTLINKADNFVRYNNGNT